MGIAPPAKLPGRTTPPPPAPSGGAFAAAARAANPAGQPPAPIPAPHPTPIRPAATDAGRDGRMAALDGEIRLRAAKDPAALAAYDKLRQSPAYAASPPETRETLLAQARNYPNPRSIGNLERLAGKDWFKAMGQDAAHGHADQQRAAKMIAYNTEAPRGDPAIRANTVEQMLSDPGVDVAFVDDHNGIAATSDHAMTSKPNAAGRYVTPLLPQVAAEQVGNIPGLSQPGGQVFLVRSARTADDNPVDPGEHGAFTGGVAHEVNHAVNPRSGRGAFQGMMNEHRASITGYRAERRPDDADPAPLTPQGQAANIIDRYIGPNASYKYIRDGYQNDPEQRRQIQDYMARQLDVNRCLVDPSKPNFIAVEDVNHPDYALPTNIMNPANYTQADLAPEPEHPGAANNTDNAVR